MYHNKVTPASLLWKDMATKNATVKWTLRLSELTLVKTFILTFNIYAICFISQLFNFFYDMLNHVADGKFHLICFIQETFFVQKF